ncbi:MAG: hypothetical protein A3F80_03265 [Candidatus Melainabacteria bacterium RIFCSPLOWO2_12_FULL_35_11]|nr:MAG: hypothetical protein A3F80_03265 [Candidatus Melainabacteria bacterium RIFCSPLOWO2_12_FULL_35_11]
MSLSEAASRIAQHTSTLEFISSQIATTEGDAIKAAGTKDGGASTKAVVSRLQYLKTLYGMIKDFIEFWKDVIKSVLALLKMFTELAQGSR